MSWKNWINQALNPTDVRQARWTEATIGILAPAAMFYVIYGMVQAIFGDMFAVFALVVIATLIAGPAVSRYRLLDGLPRTQHIFAETFLASAICLLALGATTLADPPSTAMDLLQALLLIAVTTVLAAAVIQVIFTWTEPHQTPTKED